MNLNNLKFFIARIYVLGITIIINIAAANVTIIDIVCAWTWTVIVVVVAADCTSAIIVCVAELKSAMAFVATIFIDLIQKTLEILHFATHRMRELLIGPQWSNAYNSIHFVLTSESKGTHRMCELIC